MGLCLIPSWTKVLSLKRLLVSDNQSVRLHANGGLQFIGIENAKILVANTPMDTDKIKIFGATIEAESPEQVAAIEKAERERMLAKCEKILGHGINCFINRQLIYNLPEQVCRAPELFSDNSVFC